MEFLPILRREQKPRPVREGLVGPLESALQHEIRHRTLLRLSRRSNAPLRLGRQAEVELLGSGGAGHWRKDEGFA